VKEDLRKELLKTVFDLRKAEFSAKCFAPGMRCPRPAIRAHSVQNARVLDMLADDGHVIAPLVRLDANSGPSIQFERVGRNRATTFAGLCGEHDHQLFTVIDSGEIDTDNAEHAFLLAFRAVLYEVHATSAAAWQLQMGYLKRTELGLDPKDEPSEAGIMATHRMIVAYETFMYKQKFDAAYLTGDFSILTHDVLTLNATRPTIAASTLFSLDHLIRGDETVHVCLTILPLQHSKTVAVFSYLNEDAELARSELQPVLAAPADERAFQLSRRLLNNCQNFVLSPTYFASWPPEKVAAITNYFVKTLLHDDLSLNDPQLMLFESRV
jgi:hypothetical protein